MILIFHKQHSIHSLSNHNSLFPQNHLSLIKNLQLLPSFHHLLKLNGKTTQSHPPRRLRSRKNQHHKPIRQRLFLITFQRHNRCPIHQHKPLNRRLRCPIQHLRYSRSIKIQSTGPNVLPISRCNDLSLRYNKPKVLLKLTPVNTRTRTERSLKIFISNHRKQIRLDQR